MKKPFLLLLISLTLSISGCSQPNATDRKVGDGCDECELMFEGMPLNIEWETSIASPEEPGERLLMSGTIFKPDGKTPAAGVILYVYHTDNKGIYSPSRGQTNGKRHGHLRGWMKTDSKGRYQFTSIRPASYPNRTAPQHIHPLIKEPGLSLYWIDEFRFKDDPLLTAEDISKEDKRGGSGIIQLVKNEKGVWVGHRDIILGQNIPNY